MYYTYVLFCADKKLYTGSSVDLQKRLERHQKGLVLATRKRLPVKLVYYETCLDKSLAIKREKYFKTGFGRRFLKNRIFIPR